MTHSFSYYYSPLHVSLLNYYQQKISSRCRETGKILVLFRIENTEKMKKKKIRMVKMIKQTLKYVPNKPNRKEVCMVLLIIYIAVRGVRLTKEEFQKMKTEI